MLLIGETDANHLWVMEEQMMPFVPLVRTRNVDEAIEGIREGIAAFRESGIDDATVRRTANAMRGRMLMRRVTRVNRAYFTGVERLEGRPLGDDEARLDALLEVEASDVERVVRKYVSPDRCAVITIR